MNSYITKVVSFFSICYLGICFPSAHLYAQESGKPLVLLSNFSDQQKAEKAAQSFNKRSLQTLIKPIITTVSYHRLEFGPFRFKRDAVSFVDSIKKNGFTAIVIERKYDFVIELGRYQTQQQLKIKMKQAKNKGYRLLRGLLVEEKLTSYDLFVEKISPDTEENTQRLSAIIKEEKTSRQYTSRKQALTEARKINKANTVRASVIQNKRTIINYFYGPYSNYKIATQMIRTLKKANIDAELSWDKDQRGYILSIINNNNKSKSNLFSNSIINTVGEPKQKNIKKISYEVITRPLKSQTNKTASRIASRSQNATKKQTTVLQTLSNSRAQQKSEQLRRKGIPSKIQQKTEDVNLQALVLTDISSWSQARRIVKQLKRQGIEAFPVSNRHDKHFTVTVGYSVSVGIYQDQANIQKQLDKVQQLGYGNAEIVNYSKEITSYEVIANKPGQTTRTLTKPQPQSIDGLAEEMDSEQNSSLFDETEDEEMLVFLDTDSLASDSDSTDSESNNTDQKNYRFSLDQISSSYNLQPDRSDVDGIFTTRVNASATTKFNSSWDAKISLSAKYWQQLGTLEFDNTELLVNDAFVRYRGSNYRVTIGNQTVLWGRLDGDAPTDMMSTRDLSFLVLDPELDQQRLGDTSIRMESYFDSYKVDLLYTPSPIATSLPEINSAFSFINKSTGRILGVEPLPVIEQLAIFGSSEAPKKGEAAFGIRISHAGESLDYAITAQQTRIPTPTFAINPETLFFLATGSTVNDAITLTEGETFLVYQPETSVFGGDFGWVEGVSTIRGEIAWISDYPVIRESTLSFDTTAAVSWGVGIETYPGETEDTRLIIQFVGTQLVDENDVLGDLSSISFNGQIETFFMRDKLRTRVNFLASLNKKDIFLNPEISYTGWTGHEFYLSFFYFEGNDDTVGGFFNQSNTLSLGWRGTFD